MVHFISGKMNDGKTTSLISTYRESGVGEGFALIKVMKDSKVHSYIARKLSSDEERLFIIRDSWLAEDFDQVCKIGPYCFSKSTLRWIESTIKEAVREGVSPIYLDEVGVLELQGEGYSDLIKFLVKERIDLYLTIRDDLLKKVMTYFDIVDYEMRRN